MQKRFRLYSWDNSNQHWVARFYTDDIQAARNEGVRLGGQCEYIIMFDARIREVTFRWNNGREDANPYWIDSYNITVGQ